ncbi:MAG: hypothetical protein D4R95_07450 [Actinobacteria bacterium]|nr:MAG: hypothetical protein D4R95_07450 [Actinomycetota bacterium]
MSQQAALLDINQIGNLMADQPEKTKDSPATVQDLRNMGIAIDANFIVIRSEMATGFAKVESEFKSVRSEAKTDTALLRSEMATGFAKVESEIKSVRGEAKTESALLRSDMATDFANLDRRVSQLFKADIRWQAGFALTIIGAMITIAKFVI